MEAKLEIRLGRAQDEAAAPAVEWLTTEVALYGLLFCAALAMRLAALGRWPLLRAEVDTALAAWRALQGSAWRPTYYSLLLYDANLVLFGLTRATDAATRLLPALVGAGLVVAPYLARDVLGRVGALLASALFALAPTWLAYSRTSEGSILAAAAVVALLFSVRRFARTGEPEHLRIGVVALALGLTAGPGVYTFLLAVAVLGLVYWYRRDRDLAWARAATLARAGLTRGNLLLFAGVLLFVASAFLTDLGGVGATVELVGRWASDLAPGASGLPWHYQPRLLLLYEPLTLALAVLGAMWGLWRRDTADVLVAGWALLALLLCVVLGHREPFWLLDLLLPLVLLAARGFDRLWHGLISRLTLYDGVALAVALVVAVFCLLNLASYLHTGDEQHIWRLLVGVGVLVATWAFYWLMGDRAAGPRVAAAFLGLLLIGITLRATTAAAYQHARNPRELLVHRPTSAQVRDLTEFLTWASSRMAGDPHLLDVEYETALEPWLAWYLRDFPKARSVPRAGLQSEATALVTTVRAEGTWPGGYAGQRFPLLESVPDQELSVREWLRWFIYRDAVGYDQSEEVEVWIKLPQGDTAR